MILPNHKLFSLSKLTEKERMPSLKISSSLIDDIRTHAEEVYNHECCGALLGIEQDGERVIHSVVRMKNITSEDPQRRYSIDPFELLEVEDVAEAQRLEVLGIYHSHPDHSSRPSKFDRDHAFPFLSYLIISVYNGKVKDITSWRLPKRNKSEFEKERIEVIIDS